MNVGRLYPALSPELVPQTRLKPPTFPGGRACGSPQAAYCLICSQRHYEETAMIGVVATLEIQDGKQGEFESVAKDLMAKVKANEPG